MSTLITLGVIAALSLLLAIPGIPAAILIMRKRTLYGAQVVSLGLFLGLAIELVIVLGLVHLSLYTTPIFALAMVVVSVGLWAGVLASRPTIQRPSFTPAGTAMGIIFGAAVFLRTDPIYFIYQTADFGEYINRSNTVASGGPFGEWFLNLFPAALSVPSLIFGSLHTVDVVPLLGLLLVVGIAAISNELDFPPWVTVTGAFITAFHIIPVWFSEFPASETLFAVVFVGMLLVLVTAVNRRSTAAALVAGSFGFLLAIARANAMLLAPIVVLASIAAIMVVDKRAATTTTRFIWSFFVASLVGFYYDITNNFLYFVDFQLGLFFPESVTRTVGSVRNPMVALGVGASLAGVVWAMIFIVRSIAERRDLARRLSTVLPLAFIAWLFLFVAWRALSRDLASPTGGVLILGPALIALAITGVVIGALAPHRLPPGRSVVYWIATVAGVAFVALQAVRLDTSANTVAPYFLYWQRYYVSEVFPIAVVLSLWALEALISRAGELVHNDKWRRLMPATVAIVVMTVIGIEALGPNIAVASGTMFENSYETLADLDRMTSTPQDAPIIYIGSNEVPAGWFWPNTARLIALPLADTFGRRVIGNRTPREPDLHPSDSELIAILNSLDVDTAYLLTDAKAIPDGTVLSNNGWEMSNVGTVDVTIARLPWNRGTATRDQRYVSTTLRVLVYRVER